MGPAREGVEGVEEGAGLQGASIFLSESSYDAVSAITVQWLLIVRCLGSSSLDLLFLRDKN